jgi:hypothetical protein
LGTSLLRSCPLCALTLRMRRVAGLRKRWSSSAGFPRLTRGFGHDRLKVCKARLGVRASAFGQSGCISASQGSVPPNKSFKPTPHRGVNSVLYATLHAVATPPWGGLTQALGGKKHSSVALSALQHTGFGQHCSSDGSWARCSFGQACCARSHFACVALAGFGSGDRHLRVCRG